MNEIEKEVNKLKSLKLQAEDRIKILNSLLIEHRRFINEINKRMEVLNKLVDIKNTKLKLPDFNLNNNNMPCLYIEDTNVEKDEYWK